MGDTRRDYVFDEQTVVDLERSERGYHPCSVHTYLPGRSQHLPVRDDVRRRSYATPEAAATAAVTDARRVQPALEDWAKREGFA